MKKLAWAAMAAVLVLAGCKHHQPVMKLAVTTEMRHETFSSPIKIGLECELRPEATKDKK